MALRELPADFAESLYSAIKRDNIKAFDSCMNVYPCGNLRMGRFPTLSAMYLLKARKIIKKYEKQFIKIFHWQTAIGEPNELSATFRKVAGKCLRLYIDETVTPQEMLLLCDNTKKLKTSFADFNSSDAVKDRIKNAYYIRYGLPVQYNQDGTIALARRPMTASDRRFIAVMCSCTAVVVAISVALPFAINAIHPFMKKKGAINVKNEQKIDFSSEQTYVLEDDITIDSQNENAICSIDGDGNTIKIVADGCAFENFYGTISNAIIEVDCPEVAFKNFSGEIINSTVISKSATVFGNVTGKITDCEIRAEGNGALIDNLYGGATLCGCKINSNGNSAIINTAYYRSTVSDIEVDCTVDRVANEDLSFVVNTNYGKVSNVTLKVEGRIEFGEYAQKDASLIAGGIAAYNDYSTDGIYYYYGEISNCSADYNSLVLTNSSTANNASFGGIAGINAANIKDCQTTGEITADTVDIAGICNTNGYFVMRCKNSAKLTQTSDSGQWNPLVAGIALINNYEIASCINCGEITSASTYQVVDDNAPQVTAGGIVANNNMTASDKGYLIFGLIEKCINEGEITATATDNETACAGGIAGQLAEYLLNSGTQNEGYFGGCVLNNYSLGKVSSSGMQAGAIVGIFGDSIYENNTFYFNYKHYYNTYGNKYVPQEDLLAIGTTMRRDEDKQPLYAAGGDKGCSSISAEELKSDSAYLEILNNLKR